MLNSFHIFVTLIPFLLAPIAAGQQERWRAGNVRPNAGWDYDGTRILGHVGTDICLWDATTGKPIKKFSGHKERIVAVQISPDGKMALSSSWMPPGETMRESKDTRVILWSLEEVKAGPGAEAKNDNEPIRDFSGQVAGEFSPDGKQILTFSARPGQLGSFDAAVWDSTTGRQLSRAKLDDFSFPDDGASCSLHFSPDGQEFARIGPGDSVLYKAGDGSELGRIATRASLPRSSHYTSGGALGLVEAGKTKLVDIRSGNTIADVAHEMPEDFWAAVWTPDGGKVVMIPSNGPIKIQDIRSGKTIVGAMGGIPPRRTAFVSPDNTFLAVEWGGASAGSGNVAPELAIYDLASGEQTARLKLAEWSHVLGFSPDGKTILTGGSEFVIYDSRSGQQLRAFNLLDQIDSHDW